VDLVEGAEAFASLRVADVMTPRADIVALEVSTPLEEVVRRFVEVELTRLPLYRESLDDPVGVLHIKDVVRLIAPSPDGRGPAWASPPPKRLRREALYVPASMRCADLLLRMRVARIHMALVIDEFGGTDGLVTLEDLIEAVVGDIGDEHDEEAAPEIAARPGGWEADARAPLEALEAMLGTQLAPRGEEEEEIETVGGLVSAVAGRVPQRGEVIVHPAGLEFEVLDADPRRLRRLRIRRLALDARGVAVPDASPEAAGAEAARAPAHPA
jgi:CBS domain containing-hemolysin-like protein